MEIKKEKLVIKLSEEEKEAVKILQDMGNYIYNHNYCKNKGCEHCPLEKMCGSEDFVENLESFLNNDE